MGKRDERLYENISLTLEEIAKFWTTVTYGVYHINIVKIWIETTQTTACLAAERTMESMSAQRLAASPRVDLRERGSHETNDVDMEKILRVDLFHLVAGLMSCWYKDLPMHYIEELIDSYLGERIHSMKKSKSNEVAVNWSMVRDISEYCLYDKDGCRKDLQEMIDEMEYLLDIRHRLKCQRSSDATDESSQDLSREEVPRCYYIWKADFLQKSAWV